MKRFVNYRYSAITVLIIISLVFLFTKCINNHIEDTGAIKNSRGQKFAGSATCANCHKNIYDKHLHTAHYLTSRVASRDYIKGSFEAGKNTFSYDAANVVSMEQ